MFFRKLALIAMGMAVSACATSVAIKPPLENPVTVRIPVKPPYEPEKKRLSGREKMSYVFDHGSLLMLDSRPQTIASLQWRADQAKLFLSYALKNGFEINYNDCVKRRMSAGDYKLKFVSREIFQMLNPAVDTVAFTSILSTIPASQPGMSATEYVNTIFFPTDQDFSPLVFSLLIVHELTHVCQFDVILARYDNDPNKFLWSWELLGLILRPSVSLEAAIDREFEAEMVASAYLAFLMESPVTDDIMEYDRPHDLKILADTAWECSEFLAGRLKSDVRSFMSRRTLSR